MSAEWLNKIGVKLGEGHGTEAQRNAVWEAALKIDQIIGSWAPCRNATAFETMIRGAFEKWVDRKAYIVTELEIDHYLPATRIKSEQQIAAEYGLTSSRGVEAKKNELDYCRNQRITRATEYLQRGWAPEDCITFVGAKDEWQAAVAGGIRQDDDHWWDR